MLSNSLHWENPRQCFTKHNGSLHTPLYLFLLSSERKHSSDGWQHFLCYRSSFGVGCLLFWGEWCHHLIWKRKYNIGVLLSFYEIYIIFHILNQLYYQLNLFQYYNTIIKYVFLLHVRMGRSPMTSTVLRYSIYTYLMLKHDHFSVYPIGSHCVPPLQW